MSDITIDLKNEFEKFSKIDGWFNDYEGQVLFSLVQQSGQWGHIVEIGSWKGKSGSYLALAAKIRNEKIICIEHFFGDGKGHEELLLKSPGHNSFTEFSTNMKNNDLYENIITIATDSTKAAYIWNKPIKLIFIDGAHTYEAVKNDFNLFEKFVLVGGYVCFHDVDQNMENDIARLIKEIQAEGKYEFKGIGGSVGVMLKIK